MGSYIGASLMFTSLNSNTSVKFCIISTFLEIKILRLKMIRVRSLCKVTETVRGRERKRDTEKVGRGGGRRPVSEGTKSFILDKLKLMHQLGTQVEMSSRKLEAHV